MIRIESEAPEEREGEKRGSWRVRGSISVGSVHIYVSNKHSTVELASKKSTMLSRHHRLLYLRLQHTGVFNLT